MFALEYNKGAAICKEQNENFKNFPLWGSFFGTFGRLLKII